MSLRGKQGIKESYSQNAREGTTRSKVVLYLTHPCDKHAPSTLNAKIAKVVLS